jgi:cell division protein FtsQ
MTLRGGGTGQPPGGLDAPRPAHEDTAQRGTAQQDAAQPGGGAAPGPSGGAAGSSGGARRPRLAARRGAVPWRAVAVGGVAVVIVLGIAWALLGSTVLVVRHIKVTGNRQVTAARIRAASGIRQGTPLLRLDAAAAARRVERISKVASARVSRSWPDTVIISVRMRTPALAVASDGGFELIDADGVVLRSLSRRPTALPLLRPAPVTLHRNPAVRAAARVLAELPGSIRDRVLAVTARTADGVTLHLRGRLTVRWGGTDRAAAKAKELRTLMRTHARYYDVSSPADAVTGG